MNTLVHPATPEEIMAFLDAELPPPASQELERHLAHCAECTAIASQFRAASRSLAEWSVPVTAVHLDQAVINRAAMLRAPRGETSPRKPWTIGGALATATILLLVAIPFAPHPLMRSSQAPTASQPESALAMRKARGAMPEDAAPRGGLMGGIGTAAPQIAGVAGMASPPMLREEAAPPPSMAMMARAYAPARMADNGSSTPSFATPMIAHTVALILRVRDIPNARAALDRIVAQHQGYAAELTFTAADAGFPTLQASLRIPAPELTAAVAELKTLGLVENETQTGEELSQQHQDLLARLKNSRATEERFRLILQQHTGSVSSILEVEQAIATVREEIERMEAEQQALEHRVTYASVNLRLVSLASARTNAPAFSSRLREAFEAGLHNATETVFGVALFFAEYGLTLLIWLVLLGIPVVLLWLRYRSNRVRS